MTLVMKYCEVCGYIGRALKYGKTCPSCKEKGGWTMMGTEPLVVFFPMYSVTNEMAARLTERTGLTIESLLHIALVTIENILDGKLQLRQVRADLVRLIKEAKT